MGSFNSSALRKIAKPAAVSAVEAFVAVAVAAAVCSMIWRSPDERKAVALGLAAAWLVSSLGAAGIMYAKTRDLKAFWWAFGLGMGARFATLFGLMAYSVFNPELSQPALLLAYALGVLAVLLIEYRHVKLK